MTSPAPGRCRPAAPPAPRQALAAPPRRQTRPRDQDLRQRPPTASPPPTRRSYRQASLTIGERQEDLTAGHASAHTSGSTETGAPALGSGARRRVRRRAGGSP